MTPGYTGAEIENLVNTAITQAIHEHKWVFYFLPFFRAEASPMDFENARDRIMMGIERKNLTMDEKTRL